MWEVSEEGDKTGPSQQVQTWESCNKAPCEAMNPRQDRGSMGAPAETAVGEEA